MRSQLVFLTLFALGATASGQTLVPITFKLQDKTVTSMVAGAYCQARLNTPYNVAAVNRAFGGSSTCQEACLKLFNGTYLGKGIADVGIVREPTGVVATISSRGDSGVESGSAADDWCCCQQ